MDVSSLRDYLATVGPDQIATYSRVSTDKQERGHALERMIWDCDRALERLGVAPEAVHHYQDIESGTIDFRAGLVTLEAAVESGVKVLVLYRVDRLGRRLTRASGLVDTFIKHKVFVYSVRDAKAYDLSQTSDWSDIMSQLLDADKEVRNLKRRIDDGLEYKATQLGHHLGTPPFGLRRVEGVLVRDDRPHAGSPLGLSRWDTAKAALQIMIGLDYQHLTGSEKAGKIARDLGYEKAWTDHIRWALSPATQGHTVNKRATVKDTHEALVTAEQAAIIQRSRHRSLGKEQRPNGSAADYIFSGLLFCAICGRRYAGGCKPLASGVRVYYRCRGRLTPQSPCYRAALPPGYRAAIPQTELMSFAASLFATRIPEILSHAFAPDYGPPTISPEELKAQAELSDIENLIARYGDNTGALRAAASRLRAQFQTAKTDTQTGASILLPDTASLMSFYCSTSGPGAAGIGANLATVLDANTFRTLALSVIDSVTLEFDKIKSVKLKQYR